MQRFLRPLRWAMVLLAMSTNSARAQGPIPVIEVGGNLAANSTTSVLMGEQVLNSTEQVRLETLLEEYGRRNLIPGGTGGGGILDFLKLLDEVLATGLALHYQIPDLDTQMASRFPGYVHPGRWIPNYMKVVDTSLHTLRSTLLTTREQLKLSQQMKEDGIMSGLGGLNRSARGNLQVNQAGNAINLEVVSQLRKMRQMLGATINAANVATSHDINMRAASERVFFDWIEKSQISVVAYNGGGGFSAASFEK